MILSDREIRAALGRGALRITPDPPAEAWSSTALDLRLAKDLLLWKRPSAGGVESVVCPARLFLIILFYSFFAYFFRMFSMMATIHRAR